MAVLEGRNAIQRAMERFERGVRVNLIKLDRVKIKVLHLGKHKYRLGGEYI